MSQSCAIVTGSLPAAPVVPAVVLAVVSPDVAAVPVVVSVPLALAVVSVDVPVVPVVPLALAVVSVDVPVVAPLPVVVVVPDVPTDAVCMVLQSCSTCACCSGVRLDQADRISSPLFNDVIVLSLKNASAIAPLQLPVVLFSASVICSMPGDAVVLPDVVAEVPEVAPEVVSLVPEVAPEVVPLEPELVCAIAVEAMARDTAAARMSLCFI